jgi:hypothetical protein
LRSIIFLLGILLLRLHALAQDDFLITLEKNFQSHQQVPAEKIFLHADKEVYLAGEIIWFKLYDVEATPHTASLLSRVAYVELLDKDHVPVAQGQVLLQNGKGSGSFRVPSSVASGNFLLRAYTSWMKNFPADYFFHKAITIINPSKRPDWISLEKPTAYHFMMYPEGGSLVEGLSSRVAFHLTNAYGQGVDCRGVVLDEKRDTVTSFSAEDFGMGSFQFTPQKGHQYKVFCQLPDRQFLEQKLPEVMESGFVMSVTEDRAHLQVTVTSTFSSSACYLFVHTGKEMKGAWASSIRNGKASWTIPIEKLGEGISHLTVFDEGRQPVCERLYFKLPEKQLSIQLQSDKQQYATRSKIDLQIISRNDSAGFTPADLSLAVVMVDSLRRLTPESMHAYLWLQSDLKGKIESPDFYFSGKPEAKRAADNLMLTQGWRRFTWDNVLADAKPSFEFLPDYEGTIMYGKITNKINGRPFEGRRAYLSVPGVHWRFSEGESDVNGRVAFVLDDVYGLNEMVAQTNNQKDSIARIEILHPYTEKMSSFELPPFLLPQAKAPLLSYHSVNNQVQTAFSKEKADQYVMPEKIDSAAFYGRPDQRYFLDDYTRFRTMEEVIREYVTRLHLKKEGNSYSVELDNIPYKSRFGSEPLVLVDGVPFFDFNKIMNVDPLKIKKIELVGRTYYLGHLQNSGIVSLGTYDGDLSGFELDPHAIVMEYEGLQLKRKFEAPAYGNEASLQNHLPDNRSLLHWEPDVSTGKDGRAKISFYSSDLEGNFAVIVHGINETGLAGSKVIFFQVKK